MRDMEKACTKCGEVKLLEDFGVDNRNKSGRRACCKECHNAHNRKYLEDNRDDINARKKKYREDNRNHVNALARKYREDNRDKDLARKKKDREDNPEKNAARTAKYRSAKLEQIPSWSDDDDLEAIKKVYENCRLMSILTGIPHEVDHIIPLQGEDIRGFHHSTNLAVVSADENRRKSNKWEFQEVNYG